MCQNVAFSAAIPGIKEKREEREEGKTDEGSKFKLKPQLKIQELVESEDVDSESDNESDESDNESDESEYDESEKRKPLPKIKIHPNLLSNGSISASEANRMGFKIELIKI